MSIKTEILAEPRLVGRETELTELERYLESATKGRGGTVFISGEAGSGKTRLTSEFLKSAREKELAVLSGWCLSNAAVPYFPFVEAFESFFTENEYDNKTSSQQLGLKTWLTATTQPSELPGREATSAQAWRDQRFAEVTKELMFLSIRKPVILFIDDLHWADSASLALLHYISRTVSSERILILATFRSEEIGAGSNEFVHPLADTLRLMGREDLVREVKLANLNKRDVGRIAEYMLGGKVKDVLTERLFEESQGNPLFVIESLRMLYENGALSKEREFWYLSADKLGIPNKVKDIIMRRLSALKPSQRRTLDVASVIGDKFDPQLLGVVLKQDSLEILETLNSIALTRSLVCVQGDYYRFDHAKSREILYEEILLPLRKGYHERIAETIEVLNNNTSRLPLNDLAYHFTKAGNLPKAIKYNMASGKDALSRFSNAEAINNFQFVIKATEETSEFQNERMTAMEGLGDAYFAAGLFEDATRTLARMAEMDKSELAKLRALRKAVISCYWRGDSIRGIELAKKAKQHAHVDKLEYSRLRLYKGFVLGRSFGKASEGIEEMTASLQTFEEENSLPDVARGLAEISFAYPWVGRLEDSLTAAMRSVAIYEELDDMRQQAFAIGRLGSALGVCGFLPEALEAYSEANMMDEKVCDYNAMAFHFMMSGLFLEYMRKNREAIFQSLKGLEASEKTDALYAKSLCYANLVREYSELGEIDKAEKYSGLLQTLLNSEAGLRSNQNAVATAQISKAHLLLYKGELEEAGEIYRQQLTPKGYEGKADYALFLEKLGRNSEAKKQWKKAQRMREELAKRFEKPNLRGFILGPNKSTVGAEMRIRIDVLNIGRRPAKLLRLEDLIPLRHKVLLAPSNGNWDGSILNYSSDEVSGLGTTTAKISFVPLESGEFTLKPKLVYIDDMGIQSCYFINSIKMKVSPNLSHYEFKAAADNLLTRNFKSEAARKTFEYLVKAMNDDHNRRIPEERSGWRTLMDIVKQGGVSKYSVYGSATKRGSAIYELEQAGLVEARIFAGERGRGGRILRLRAAGDKLT